MLAWKYGMVSRSPAVSQVQTMLSGAGGLRGTATLSILLVFCQLHFRVALSEIYQICKLEIRLRIGGLCCSYLN